MPVGEISAAGTFLNQALSTSCSQFLQRGFVLSALPVAGLLREQDDSLSSYRQTRAGTSHPDREQFQPISHRGKTMVSHELIVNLIGTLPPEGHYASRPTWIDKPNLATGIQVTVRTWRNKSEKSEFYGEWNYRIPPGSN
jgi:hypothetical protein